MTKKDFIAMILAGGQGSRLGVLTNEVAKPAVPFGSRYRIIDFALSNCSNSQIDTVGVLTQYQPLELNTYISNGHPWDLDRATGGAFILPPYQKMGKSDWYKNTANAIYQNIDFIDRFNPNYVLILSGDHIYKMNYMKMLDKHKEKEAAATIAVFRVPWDEASRFGIMDTNEEDAIIEFAEKPKEPKNNLASMGIYIFTWDILKKLLIEDEADEKSKHDFGGDIIPKMIDSGERVYAHEFSGYWRDVGTIDSLWEANMDLIENPEQISFSNPNWRINSRNPVKPAHFIGSTAQVKNTYMTDGCEIYGRVNHSVLGHSVIIDKGATVLNSVLMPGVVVKAGAYLDKVVVGMNSIIGENCQIGKHVLEIDEDQKNNKYIDKKLCKKDISVVGPSLEMKAKSLFPGNSMIALEGSKQEDEFLIRRDIKSL